MMKQFATLAAVAVLAALTVAADARPVTAANLALRCKTDKTPCDKAVTFIYANTSACSDAKLSHAVVVDKVIAWLKAHPRKVGTDDNDLAGAAIEALWPCHL
jgi:hypothetical protein